AGPEPGACRAGPPVPDPAPSAPPAPLGTVAVAGGPAGDGSAAGAPRAGPADGDITVIAATDPPAAASASTDAAIAPLDLVSTGVRLGRAERPVGGFRCRLARGD